MTDREKFDVELRKVEQEESLGARYGQSIMGFVRQDSNSSVSSNTSNASSMKKPKGINWADGVEDAVKSVMEGSISTLQLVCPISLVVLLVHNCRYTHIWYIRLLIWQLKFSN